MEERRKIVATEYVPPSARRSSSATDPDLERRKLLRIAGGVIAGGLVAKFAPDILFGGKDEIEEQKDPFINPFAGAEANRVANGLGITAGNFFVIEKDVMEKVTASSPEGYLKQDSGLGLLPIFPPAVHNQTDVILRVAEELEVPATVVATIASVESAGSINAESGANAHGLFQVVPDYHLDKIVKVADEAGFDIPDAEHLLHQWNEAIITGQNLPPVRTDSVIAALQDPYIGCKVGMMVLKDYYQRVLDNTQLQPESPVAWARALAAYNGGPDEAGKKYTNMPIESQLYTVHAIRYFMTAEIAAQMRNNGLDDQTIASELVSKEIDARAYAYLQTKKGKIDGTIDSYENLWFALAQPDISSPEDPELTWRMKTAYTEHRDGDHEFGYPVSAGLRLWLVHGGEGIYFADPVNADDDNYPANQ